MTILIMGRQQNSNTTTTEHRARLNNGPVAQPRTQSMVGVFPLLLLVLLVAFATLFTGVSATEECGHEELVQCAKPLQVISATSELSFVTNKDELDKICPDLNAGLHCIRSYTRRCMSIVQRQHFNKLYQGTSEVIHELCTEGAAYQEDFLRHAPCLRLVKTEYENCAKVYQATMEDLNKNEDHVENLNTTMFEAFQAERIRVVCCAFKSYVRCSEDTVRNSCGPEPALFTKTFLDKMAKSLMSMHCDEYDTDASQKCGGGAAFNRGRQLNPWQILIVPVLAVFAGMRWPFAVAA